MSATPAPAGRTLLEVNDLKKHFSLGGGLFGRSTRVLKAVDGLSFTVARGETLSLVGRIRLRQVHRRQGADAPLRARPPARWCSTGQRIDDLSAGALRPLRRHIQMVFQDPFSSLNPRMRVRAILAEPIRNFGLARNAADLEAQLASLMERVGLPREALGRFPHEFSGGQRQRIGIARALAAEPDLIICDEAVSALDVSVKAQIVNLLRDLQRELDLAMLFISHDLAIVEHMTHRVAVMYLGKIVEIGPRRDLFLAPKHPYTQALLSAVPIPEPGAGRTRIVLKGDVPSPINPPSGCRFHTRCPHAFDRCRVEVPGLDPVGAGHFAACHLNDAAAPARAA